MPFDAQVEIPAIRTVGPVEQTLIEARELIALPWKWCQVDFSRVDQQFCIVGAIIRSIGRTDDHDEAMKHIDAAEAPLRTVIGEHSVMCWNDAPERTHAEVMTAFDRAIALAAEEGA